MTKRVHLLLQTWKSVVRRQVFEALENVLLYLTDLHNTIHLILYVDLHQSSLEMKPL